MILENMSFMFTCQSRFFLQIEKQVMMTLFSKQKTEFLSSPTAGLKFF